MNILGVFSTHGTQALGGIKGVESTKAAQAAGVRLNANDSENSGLHGGIWRRGVDGVWAWDGGADDRREGVARTR